jgi:hypothetical protein
MAYGDTMPLIRAAPWPERDNPVQATSSACILAMASAS